MFGDGRRDHHRRQDLVLSLSSSHLNVGASFLSVPRATYLLGSLCQRRATAKRRNVRIEIDDSTSCHRNLQGLLTCTETLGDLSAFSWDTKKSPAKVCSYANPCYLRLKLTIMRNLFDSWEKVSDCLQ